MAAPVLIVGVGNILLSDEGAGVAAVRLLEGRPLPAGTEILEAGTVGMELLAWMDGVEHLIILDAVDFDAAPGTLCRFRANGTAGWPGRPLSFHELGILEVLDAGRLIDAFPDVVVIGVQPGSLATGLELTAPVAAALPRLVELALEEAERLARVRDHAVGA